MKFKITEEGISVIFLVAITAMLGAVIVHSTFEKAQATGCPVDTIIPFIDDAMKSLEQGDTQTAQSQLQEAKNQLKDTFEVEE